MEIFAGIIGFFWIILIILAILVPVFVYSAQKWAYKSYKELVKMNNELIKMNEKLDLIKMRS